jgi:hypothetical protein
MTFRQKNQSELPLRFQLPSFPLTILESYNLDVKVTCPFEEALQFTRMSLLWQPSLATASETW